MKILNSCNFR